MSNDIKNSIEKEIPEDVKGDYYSIVVALYGNQFIINIQVDNDRFTDADECKKFMKETVEKISYIEKTSSVSFNFIANDEIMYIATIKPWDSEKYSHSYIDSLTLNPLH